MIAANNSIQTLKLVADGKYSFLKFFHQMSGTEMNRVQFFSFGERERESVCERERERERERGSVNYHDTKGTETFTYSVSNLPIGFEDQYLKKSERERM